MTMTRHENPGIARYREERDRFNLIYQMSQEADDPDLKHAGLLSKLMS